MSSQVADRLQADEMRAELLEAKPTGRADKLLRGQEYPATEASALLAVALPLLQMLPAELRRRLELHCR